jgi:hypothetical protein
VIHFYFRCCGSVSVFCLCGAGCFYFLKLKTLLCKVQMDVAVSGIERDTCAISYVTADNSRYGASYIKVICK